MSNIKKTLPFKGPFAGLLADFVQEKRASGYKYETAVIYLCQLDDLLARQNASTDCLTKELVELWATKRPNEQVNTCFSRICVSRQFACFLTRRGIPAYMAPQTHHAKYDFIPHIFTHEEIQKMFAELDGWSSFYRGADRHVVMPELFRVLYGCGLRIGEAVNLNRENVDLDEGVLIIKGAKFGKERMVPMATSLTERLRICAGKIGYSRPDSPFFPASPGTRLTHAIVYKTFRNILWKIGIPHIGRNHGPRVHDLRHTFAVHRLLQWYREGADLNAMLPKLST